MKERLVPQNVAAEMGVLGSILIDTEAYDLVADSLKVDDFYRDSHRIIYQAIVNLVAKNVRPDYLTICDELERTEKLEQVDGAAYLTSLINEVPTSGDAEYYAQIVARTAINRKLAHAAGMIAQLAYDQDDRSLEKAEQILFALQSNGMSQAFTGMTEMAKDYMVELDHLHANRGAFTGVPTGYKDIDDTLGGLQKTDLILLGGRPGSGKTSLGLCIGYNTALLYGKKVAIISLEMGKRQLMRRLTSMASKVDLQRLRSGWFNDDEWGLIIGKLGSLSQLPIWVNDTAGNPLASIRSQLRRLIQQQQGIDLLIVDYLGLIEPDEGKESENRVQEISKISGGLKKLAKEFDIPVLALAQLSREVEKRQNKRPQLSDLRESGSLEQDADVVMFLYREDYYAEQANTKDYIPNNEAEVSIAKHRNGPTGGVNLYFKGEQTMFYNLEEKLAQGREN
jgi:replicative DNA helicase